MTSVTLALGALSLLTLFALMLAVAAICQARSATRAIRKLPDSVSKEWDSVVQSLRSEVDGLAGQVHDMQQTPAQAPAIAAPRSGMNLAKRSQALRLHRHGNPAAQIAATLEIPVQEVELLIKVHRIVIDNNLQN
jgi:hypothetical protein